MKCDLYEMIDMNRGGIYHDFTDGEEVRKSWWGFQPYNPPEEPAFVNEDFINFVELRENYLIRRPIFNITTLMNEYYRAMNNLPEYVNKSKNKNKFVKNLLNLQEYLMENENNVSSINFDSVANNISNQLNVSIVNKLGCGDYGCAYDIGDKVLKITTDKSEVVENTKLLDNNLKYLATPYKIFKIVLNDGVVYAIVSEKFKTDVGDFENKLNRLKYAFKNILNLGDFEDLIDDIVLGDTEAYYNNKEKIDRYFNKNLGDKEFFFNLVEIGKELRQHNIDTLDYFSEKNLGYTKEGNVGFFDIGASFNQENPPSNLDTINVKEDGSTKFSTDNSVGRIDYPTYNQKSTEPSIENNLDANMSLYDDINEEKIEDYRRSDKILEVYKNPKSIKNMKSDIRGIIDNSGNLYVINDNYYVIHNVFAEWLNNLGYPVATNTYYNLDNTIPVQRLDNSNDFYISESIYFSEIDENFENIERIFIKAKKKNPKYNFIIQSIRDGNNELEDFQIIERKKAWIPGSKAVNVKKRCRLAGKGNTSDACNQGDINNLEFSSLNEVVAKTQKEVDNFIKDSKVKETVYHGSPVGGIEDFNLNKGKEIVTSSGLREDSMFFTSNPRLADVYRGKKLNPEFKQEIERQIRLLSNKQMTVRNNRDYDAIKNEIKKLRTILVGQIYGVKLKIKNPLIFDGKGKSNSFSGSGWDELKIDLGYKIARGKEAINLIATRNEVAKDYWKYDGIIAKNIIDLDSYTNIPNDKNSEYLGNAYVVFSPDQILILGIELMNDKMSVNISEFNTSDACNQGDINNLEFTPLKEDIDPKEAYNDNDALKTVIDGKRDVAFIGVSDNNKSLIEDAGLKMIGPIFQKEYGYSQNKYIIYRDINKAKELQKILEKNMGYLPINTPEETRRIGELLGYRKESIDKFIERHFSKEPINENVMEEGNGIMGLQELPFKNEIYKMGGKIYSVGGAVRDEFLGKKSKDLDILITGIPMDKLSQIMSNYGKVDAVGKSFGILKFKPEGANEEIDVAIPRTEVPTGAGGHKGFDVKSDHALPIEKDLQRRDFTINAIAKDIQGNIIDPFGGQQDLQNRIIRVVNPKAFADDPLRMLRAVQFASRFNFDIEPKTLRMIKENAHRIKEIPPERILTEFEKIIKKGDILTGVEELVKTNLFNNIFGFDPNKSNFGRSDFNDVKTMGEFIYLLTRSIDNPAEFYKNKLKGDVDTFKEIKGLMIGMNDKQENPLKNRSTAFNINAISSKALNSGILPPPIKRAAAEFKIGKYPKTIKDLEVDGNDLKRFGLEGAEIGNKLKWLLINVYADNVRNSKEELLRLLGYQPSENH